MAAIDKIYGTLDQYDELHAFVGMHKPEYLRHFYPRNDEIPRDMVRALTNFTTEADVWLAENCEIGWALDRLRVQYDGRLPRASDSIDDDDGVRAIQDALESLSVSDDEWDRVAQEPYG